MEEKARWKRLFSGLDHRTSNYTASHLANGPYCQASSVSWSLHCNLGFPLTASRPDHSRIPHRASNPSTHWLASVAFWNLIGKFYNIHTLASCVPEKLASHGQCQVPLPAGDAAWTSLNTAAAASVCLHGWDLENTSLDSIAEIHCYEGSHCISISFQMTVLKWVWIFISLFCLHGVLHPLGTFLVDPDVFI